MCWPKHSFLKWTGAQHRNHHSLAEVVAVFSPKRYEPIRRRFRYHQLVLSWLVLHEFGTIDLRQSAQVHAAVFHEIIAKLYQPLLRGWLHYAGHCRVQAESVRINTDQHVIRRLGVSVSRGRVRVTDHCVSQIKRILMELRQVLRDRNIPERLLDLSVRRQEARGERSRISRDCRFNQCAVPERFGCHLVECGCNAAYFSEEILGIEQ